MQVGILGCGNVGTSIAFALIYSSKVNIIKIYNRDRNKLRGVVMDLEDAGYVNNTIVTSAEIEEIKKCDYIILTVGRKQKVGEDRASLYEENFKIVNHYMKLLCKYKKKVLVVSNPVDLITTKLRELYPYIDIISTHTDIDKVRLNQLTKNHAELMGTHDTVKRVVIDGKTDIELTEIVNEKAGEIIYYKGETCFGIASVVKKIIENDIKK